jgi:integrase
MRNANTFGIQFILRKNKAKEDKAPLNLRITVDGKRVEISLKKWIPMEVWNDDKGVLRGNREEVKVLNNYLDQIRNRLFEIYQDMQLEHQLITAEAIKNKYLGIEEKGYTLCRLIEYHNAEQGIVLEWGTMKNYQTTKKYIELFLSSQLKRPDIFLSELSYKFINDFEFFLRKYVPEDHHLPMGNNTVMKHIERLRKMINLAIKFEWIDKDPFLKFKAHFTKSDRSFLTEAELQRIEKKNLKIERLRFTRDLFVFSCYTGLAYIDVMQLTQENIVLGIDGEKWINTYRQKTDIPIRLPLLPQAIEVMNKYSNNPRAVSKGKLFPTVSNQRLNGYLKEVADLCEITKDLTFHMARHTFATTVTLCNNVPIETVSKMLGHTSIRTTQIYAKVVEKKVSNDMKALLTKLDDIRQA